MSMPAIASKARKVVSVVADGVIHTGTVGGFLLLLAAVLMPLGQVAIDYWTPKIQALMLVPQPAIKQPVKGKL